jgi:hypothetical protein
MFRAVLIVTLGATVPWSWCGGHRSLRQVGINDLPEALPANIAKETHADLLTLLHTVLVDVRVPSHHLFCSPRVHVWSPLRSVH